MEWEVLRYGHIPGVILEANQTVPLGVGELRHVAFDEWSTFVGRHVELSERHYNNTLSTFYVDTMLIDDQEGVDIDFDLHEPFRVLLRRIHTALIFTLGRILPDPLHSTRYLLVPDSKERFRDIGDRDIEWMIYGALPYTESVPQDLEVPLGRMLARLNEVDYGPSTPELQHVLDVIKLAAEPPLSTMDVVMHAAIALEDVLNPWANRPLGRVFARRGAVICTNHYEGIEASEEWFRDLYSIRSKCIHGEDPSSALNSLKRWSEDPLVPVISTCFRIGEALGQYIHRHGAGGAATILQHDVDYAVDRGSYQQFHEGLIKEWFHR